MYIIFFYLWIFKDKFNLYSPAPAGFSGSSSTCWTPDRCTTWPRTDPCLGELIAAVCSSTSLSLKRWHRLVRLNADWLVRFRIRFSKKKKIWHKTQYCPTTLQGRRKIIWKKKDTQFTVLNPAIQSWWTTSEFPMTKSAKFRPSTDGLTVLQCLQTNSGVITAITCRRVTSHFRHT